LGEFGEVWLGSYRGVKVAVKKLLKKTNTHEEEAKLIDNFSAEAKIHKELPPHPNVVLFLGITISPHPLCMVLEYCKGGSLNTLLHSDDAISATQMIKFCKDIAKGMGHLHYGVKGAQVVHRDLASRNILLKKGSCAISDFGMARVKQESDDSSKTKSNIGPVKWMAPESLSRREYSIKSDIFQFGVVVYEIVSRKHPWEEMTSSEAILAVVSGKRMEIPSDSPPILSRLMEMCWEHDPNDRPTFVTIISMLKNREKESSNIAIYEKGYNVPENDYINLVIATDDDDKDPYSIYVQKEYNLLHLPTQILDLTSKSELIILV